METLDLYCERLGPGLWAEPINALTNIAFFLSALALWHTAREERRLAPGVWLLIALVVTIGVGSTLFHTLATPWARLADELPILVFQLGFVWMYARRVMRLKLVGALVLLAAFFALAMAGRQFPHVLNNSLVYAAAVVFIVGLGLYHAAARKEEPRILLWAAAVLAVSVVLRTLDLAACEDFPMGTHFFWHLLNALVLYLAARGLVVNLAARR